MTSRISAYAAYGVRVAIEDDRHPYEIDEEIGWSGPVVFMQAGKYDDGMQWLFIRTQDGEMAMEPGQYKAVDPYRATDDPYPLWDWQLTDTAQTQRLKILDGPAWLFVPNHC